jgi:hypothetical protein
MRSWFNLYPNPNDALFDSLVEELNDSNIRKQRKQVNTKKLKIWWRNEKVRQKRIISRIERGEDVIKSGRGRKRKDSNSGLAVIDCTQATVTMDPVTPSVCHGHEPERNMIELERSPPMGSPVGQDLSPAEVSVSSPLPTHSSEQRPYLTVDRSIFQQPPVYPVPYISLTPNNFQDGNIPRAGSHLEMLSPHSPPMVSRYFSSPRRENAEKMMLPLKDQPIVYQHHSPYGN